MSMTLTPALSRNRLGLMEVEWRTCALVVAVNVALAATIFAVGGADPGFLMRDVVSIAGLPPYAGAYGYVAVLLYAAGASVALFAAALLPSGAGPRRGLLALGGGYMAFGCLDDLYLLHEHGLYLGLPEKAVLLLHAALLGWLLVRTLAARRGTPWPLLALGSFALSTALDVTRRRFEAQGLAEEFFETTGVALLTACRALRAEGAGPSRTARAPA